MLKNCILLKKMAYYFCLSLRVNLDFLAFLQKCFDNIDYWTDSIVVLVA